MHHELELQQDVPELSQNDRIAQGGPSWSETNYRLALGSSCKDTIPSG